MCIVVAHCLTGRVGAAAAASSSLGVAREVMLAGRMPRRKLLLLPLANLGENERLHLARCRYRGAHRVEQPCLQLRGHGVCNVRRALSRVMILDAFNYHVTILDALNYRPPPLRALPFHLAIACACECVCALAARAGV